MKIALLFFGQPRFLDNPLPYLKHKKFFLDKHDTDVYCHTWWEEEAKYDCSTWSRINTCETDKDAIKKIQQMYKPVDLVFESPKKFSFKAESQESINQIIKKKWPRGHAHWNSNNDNYSNILSQLYSIEQVCKLCAKSSEKYDFIVLSRFDNNIIEFPEDLHELDSGKFYISDLHPRFPDMVYFFSQKFLESQYFYSRVDYIIEKYKWSLWEPSNEAFKYFSTIDFLNNESLFRPVRIRVKAVRDLTGSG